MMVITPAFQHPSSQKSTGSTLGHSVKIIVYQAQNKKYLQRTEPTAYAISPLLGPIVLKGVSLGLVKVPSPTCATTSNAQITNS